MTKALLEKIDETRVETIRKKGEMWPGGDIRILGNQWLRSAYHASDLVKVPRENSLRKSLMKVIKKKKLRSGLSLFYSCYLFRLQHNK